MRTTDILMSEHRVIEQVLSCLDKMAEETFAKSTIDVASARDVVDFLRNFADSFHHMKEEDRLFPAMERHGMPPQAGPTAVMRHEHELGRAHVRKIDDAISAFEKGDAAAADRFAFEARGFIDLLREHIAKEDEILFPMADRMLPPATQDEVLRAFEHVQERAAADGTNAKYLALADSLASRWGVTKADADAAGHACSCSHGH